MKIGTREAALISRDTINPRPEPKPKTPEEKQTTVSVTTRLPGVILTRIEKAENKLTRKFSR